MPDLPTGTVTLLFADIERSTRLLKDLGDRFGGVLGEYRALLRASIGENGGREVDTQGDGFFAVFPRALDAVRAAVAVQRACQEHPWPESVSLHARMGLHTGEPRPSGGGYVGMDVHVASRICQAANGAQLLLSDTTRMLVQDDLPGGMSLRDLGEHSLRDLDRPQRLFQILAPGLRDDFPPLRTLDVLPNNLPRQLTSFVGREWESAEVVRLFGSTCLLTLTGAGGSGKTRLALRVAARLIDRYDDGVWVVELASLSDPGLVPRAVAAVLRVPDRPGSSPSEAVIDYLRLKSVLVVLDNCEHVVTACAGFADALLRASSGTHILATSREPLGVPGETVWRVPSLSLPDLEHFPTATQLQQGEAVRLFVERATAVQPEFRVTDGNARAVAQVCHRLDGMPLAIELAAACAKVLSVQQIAARLDDRFRLLTGGSRTVLPRHQTLEAAIDWSYGLLSEKQRIVLRRLSVFAGGWTLEAAEVVCAGGIVDASDVLGLLTQLVDKSVVVAEVQAAQARYRMLETVRQFSHDRLREGGDEEEARRRHRDWCLRLAEAAQPKLRGPAAVEWLERLEADHDNFRAALEWCAREAGGDEGLRLTVALSEFWDTRCYFSEGRAWLEAMVELETGQLPRLRAKALNFAGRMAKQQGDFDAVQRLCTQALGLFQTQGDEVGSAEALHYLAHALQDRGEHFRCAELMEKSVAMHRKAGDKEGLALSLNCLADAARSQKNYDRAVALFGEALALDREIGYGDGIATVLHNLGHATYRQGDPDRAVAFFREALAISQEIGNKWMTILCIAGIAGARAESAPEASARLLGAAEALSVSSGARFEPVDRADFDRNVATVRARLGEAAFGAAWTHGRGMALDDAVRNVLDDAYVSPSVQPGRGRGGTRAHTLTLREREVAVLVAQGLTNRDIASRLVIAERTAEGHVQSIFNKMGFNSRAQVAAWAVAEGLHTVPRS